MILVHGLCGNLKQIKNGKKNGTGYSFWRKKRCLVFSAGKLGFTEAFVQGSDNFKTSGQSCHVKVRCMCKLITKVNIIKAQNVESIVIQLCAEPVV